MRLFSTFYLFVFLNGIFAKDYENHLAIDVPESKRHWLSSKAGRIGHRLGLGITEDQKFLNELNSTKVISTKQALEIMKVLKRKKQHSSHTEISNIWKEFSKKCLKNFNFLITNNLQKFSATVNTCSKIKDLKREMFIENGNHLIAKMTLGGVSLDDETILNNEDAEENATFYITLAPKFKKGEKEIDIVPTSDIEKVKAQLDNDLGVELVEGEENGLSREGVTEETQLIKVRNKCEIEIQKDLKLREKYKWLREKNLVDLMPTNEELRVMEERREARRELNECCGPAEIEFSNGLVNRCRGYTLVKEQL